VAIPDSVTSIGIWSFHGCTRLSAIDVAPLNPAYSSLDGVLFDKSQSSLLRCPIGKLGTYIVPNNVTNIGELAFRECTSLTSVTIPGSVLSIGREWVGGLRQPPGAFQYCTGLTNVTLANGLISIGCSAFLGCTSLASVIIPDSVTSIDFCAFCGCTSLTSVTIGNSLTSIGASHFIGCTSLTLIEVDPLNTVCSSLDGVVFNKLQTELWLCPPGRAGDYTIPHSVTTIGGGAFSGCTSLTSVIIPDGVTSIGGGAFSGCTSLTSVIIPDGVTNIGMWAFSGCTGLTSATIGNSVTNIDGMAFFGCTSLTNITIPDSVASLGSGAFDSCFSLTSVWFEGNAPTTGWDVFGDSGNVTVYYLPGTTGWGSTFAGHPTALWSLPNPLILTTAPSFGVQTNGFGFIISWATNVPVVVEASPTLTTPTWSPVATNALVNGSFVFTDPQWTNHTGRFYRLRSE